MLSAITNGSTLKVGHSSTFTETLGIGNGVLVDFTPVVPLSNLYPVRGTLKIYVDDLLLAVDDSTQAGPVFTLTTVAAPVTRLSLIDVGTVFDPVLGTLVGIIFLDNANFDPPAVGAVIKVGYKALNQSDGTMMSLSKPAPANFSNFLKESPYYCLDTLNELLIIRPENLKMVTFAMVDFKEQ
jgi:hypothetical protein